MLSNYMNEYGELVEMVLTVLEENPVRLPLCTPHIPLGLSWE
jgi:hypothetical protein